jgi:nucleoside phosphorylase
VVLPGHLFPNLTKLDVDPFRGQHAQTIIAAARQGRLPRLRALRLNLTELDVPDAILLLADELEHIMPKLIVVSGVVGALSIPQW